MPDQTPFDKLREVFEGHAKAASGDRRHTWEDALRYLHDLATVEREQHEQLEEARSAMPDGDYWSGVLHRKNVEWMKDVQRANDAEKQLAAEKAKREAEKDALSDITVERLREKQRELIENGGCPACLAGDEDEHRPDCPLHPANLDIDEAMEARALAGYCPVCGIRPGHSVGCEVAKREQAERAAGRLAAIVERIRDEDAYPSLRDFIDKALATLESDLARKAGGTNA